MNKSFILSVAAVATILGFFLALAEFIQDKGENKTEIMQHISGRDNEGNIHIGNK